jgi:hypothetical protein
MRGTAVGVSEGPDQRVIVVFRDGGSTTIELNEGAARKLADDILRNANYLWPIKESNDENA